MSHPAESSLREVEVSQRNDLDENPIRIADLHSGEGWSTRAALLAGMDVVYAD